MAAFFIDGDIAVLHKKLKDRTFCKNMSMLEGMEKKLEKNYINLEALFGDFRLF